MRFWVAIIFLLFNALTSASGSGLYAVTELRDKIAANLEFLDDGGFPDKPGVGYPWLTVTAGKSKAVLICPEDGVGDAILVFEDGSVLRTAATQGDRKLDYGTLIKPQKGDKWVPFEPGDGWEKLNLNGDNLRSIFIATHFAREFYKAAVAQLKPK